MNKDIPSYRNISYILSYLSISGIFSGDLTNHEIYKAVIKTNKIAWFVIQ